MGRHPFSSLHWSTDVKGSRVIKDGVLGVVLILLPPNTASGVQTKKPYFCLRPHDLLPFLLWIIQMVIGKLQTGLDMRWLEQGDLACAAGF